MFMIQQLKAKSSGHWGHQVPITSQNGPGATGTELPQTGVHFQCTKAQNNSEET